MSIKNKIQRYIKEILDTEVDNNYKNILISETLKSNVTIKIKHEKIELETENISKESFSKKIISLVDNDTRKNMEYGKLVHKYLELADENNKVVQIFNKKINEIGIDIKNANKYHEYEFIYEEDNLIKHGIIDLLIEYNSKMYIIDYKLKEIGSKEYIKQLEGYKSYIENKTNKETECYLYSILDNKLEKIL